MQLFDLIIDYDYSPDQNALNQLNMQQAPVNNETKKPNIVGLQIVPKGTRHQMSSLTDEGINEIQMRFTKMKNTTLFIPYSKAIGTYVLRLTRMKQKFTFAFTW
jgi:hypothetical protein